MVVSEYLGETPSAELCAQVGRIGYGALARKEIAALANQMRRIVGPEPEGCKFVVVRNRHEMGHYYSLNLEFDDNSETAIEYMNKCEAQYPERWDEQAITELGPDYYVPKI